MPICWRTQTEMARSMRLGMIRTGRDDSGTSEMKVTTVRRQNQFKRRSLWLIAILTAMSAGIPMDTAHGADKFEKVAVYLEQNIQDKDAEVKFDAIGPGTGLATLQVTAPDGRVVVDFKAPASKLGIRHVTLESPEPANDGKLQADFPQGIYKFTAVTVAGVTLNGEAPLSHAFPKAATVIRPRPDEENVSATGLRVTWSEVKDIQAATVLIEQEETGQTMSVTLPANATGFAVPNGFLAAATNYKLAIGTIAKSGNRTVSETSFTTAGKK